MTFPVPAHEALEQSVRVEVPRLVWARYAGAFNQMRRERALLLAAARDADEITVDGIVVAEVRGGRVRYIPPSARGQTEKQQRGEDDPR